MLRPVAGDPVTDLGRPRADGRSSLRGAARAGPGCTRASGTAAWPRSWCSTASAVPSSPSTSSAGRARWPTDGFTAVRTGALSPPPAVPGRARGSARACRNSRCSSTTDRGRVRTGCTPHRTAGCASPTLADDRPSRPRRVRRHVVARCRRCSPTSAMPPRRTGPASCATASRGRHGTTRRLPHLRPRRAHRLRATAGGPPARTAKASPPRCCSTRCAGCAAPASAACVREHPRRQRRRTRAVPCARVRRAARNVCGSSRARRLCELARTADGHRRAPARAVLVHRHRSASSAGAARDRSIRHPVGAGCGSSAAATSPSSTQRFTHRPRRHGSSSPSACRPASTRPHSAPARVDHHRQPRA